MPTAPLAPPPVLAPALAPALDSPAAPAGPVLRGWDIVCFSNDWRGDPLSKMHLMRLLARDNRILWVNSVGYRTPSLTSKRDLGRAWAKLKAAAGPMEEVIPNLFVLNPLALPAYGPKARKVNAVLLRAQVRRAMRRLGFNKVMSWSFLPSAAVAAGSLGEQFVIYHCVDEFTKFDGVSGAAIEAMEAELMRRADAVFVSADKLLRDKGPANPRTYLVRHGVDLDHFRTALDPDLPVHPDLVGRPGPVIGYFGLMGSEWFDVPLMTKVARHFAHGTVVLVGKVTTDLGDLAKLPNVVLTGRKPYAELPAYCRGFDAAVIPFPINPVTLAANPLKAREYLAAGLPVVSTAIPEVEVLGTCRIGRTHAEFIAELDDALAEPGPSAARSETVRSESWAARLDEIQDWLLALPEQGR